MGNYVLKNSGNMQTHHQATDTLDQQTASPLAEALISPSKDSGI